MSRLYINYISFTVLSYTVKRWSHIVMVSFPLIQDGLQYFGSTGLVIIFHREKEKNA